MPPFARVTLEYETKLVRLAVLMDSGESRSDDAFSLRDQLASLDLLLPEDELEFMNALSSDLYMIEDDEILELLSPKYEATYARELMNAFNSGNWLFVLDLLRQDADNLTNEYRAYFRGRAYAQLGLLASSLEFYKYAWKLKPADVVYRYQYLDTLSYLSVEAAAVVARDYLDVPLAWPAVTILSATVLFKTTRDGDPAHNAEVYQLLADTLPVVLSDAAVVSSVPKSLISLGYIDLGFSLEILGDYASSARALEYALSVDPDTSPDLQYEVERIQSKARNRPAEPRILVPDTALHVRVFRDLAQDRDAEIERLIAA